MAKNEIKAISVSLLACPEAKCSLVFVYAHHGYFKTLIIEKLLTHASVKSCAHFDVINRGYYTAARRYDSSSSGENNILRTSAASE
jgi:hypothetical protein